jgi:hypothetical protein
VINTYVTGSLTGSNIPIQPTSYDNYNKEVQKRIYHNLSYLLKTKGTERGLRALINCFGIPSDILHIKVYGGRNANETPFYGDYRYYTSSLDKIRLDNTGSIIEGNTLSEYTSILKRDSRYTDDLHSIEIGFSPTDNVDNFIISKSLSTGSLSSFNIDNYLGDPRNLNLDEYYSIGSTNNIIGSLELLTNQIMSGSDAYNVQDFVRLLKFYDNNIFKIVKDFIPARSTATTGIVIKPHLLQRNKNKSTILLGSKSEYTGSIDTAFIEAGNGGVYSSVTQGTVEGELNTSYNQFIQTPSGLEIDARHNRQEASIDGELRDSSITVTRGELNNANLFKIPTFPTNNFHINRWINAEGLCILSPFSTYANNYGGIFYSSSNNTFYLDSGSWGSNSLYTGLSQAYMTYEITSSNIPTSSFSFPFNTDNYANYTTHSLTASNTGVTGSCTSSVNIQVAICDIDQTGFFRSSITEAGVYNVASWFVTGSQNLSSNVALNITNTTAATTVYNGLLQNANAVTFGGDQGDQYTLIVRDSQIPLTCTYTFPIIAGLCNVVTSSLPASSRTSRWSTDVFLGTTNTNAFGTPDENNFGLASYFVGIDPDNEIYSIRVYNPFTSTTVVNVGNIIPPDNNTLFTTGTGTFFILPGTTTPVYEYYWYYGPTNYPDAPAGTPSITGNVALFKIRYTQQYLTANPQIAANSNAPFSGTLFIDVTVEESLECTPKVTITPPNVPTSDDFILIGVDPCCFVGSTLVTLSDLTQVRIDTIKVGDKVLSYNEETGETLISTVVKVSSPTKKDIVKHSVSTGIEIEAARNHPFWVVDKGWSSYSPGTTKKDHDMDVEQLEEGDRLLTQEGKEVVLLKMELDENRDYEVVYNIALEGHYTYYANNILVHNKTAEQALISCP